MKKSDYNILGLFDGKRSTRPVNGYIFSFNGHRFGVTNKKIDGQKVERLWTITELTTGCSLFDSYDRKSAIERLKEMPETMWETIQRAVEKATENDMNVNPYLKPDALKS